jgi:protein farnesyltransferase/geranylgeranyltransferase type-1 subunit alpha
LSLTFSTATKLIEDDVRNNSAWNERWFAVHRGGSQAQHSIGIDIARNEADFAIGPKGVSLDPYNESPWRYLIGILKEQQQQQQQPPPDTDDDVIMNLIIEYETKAANDITQILIDADRNPDGCTNLSSARIDMLEMIGGKHSLDKVRGICVHKKNRNPIVSSYRTIAHVY